MVLDVDKKKMTIMGVSFNNKKEFRTVWNAVSSNMIEGWKPTADDVRRLQEKAISLRGKKIHG